MTQTIALKTSVESTRKTTCDVVVQKYGDGYQQRIPNSTSHINETWDIRVPIIERSQFDSVQTQLKTIGGDPFLWQADSSFTLDSYVCDRYAFQEEIYAYKTLSATFRRSPKFQYVAILDNTIKLKLKANIDSQFSAENKERIQRYRSGSEQRRQDGLNYTFDTVSVVVAKLSRAEADELHSILSQLGGISAFAWEPDGAIATSATKLYVCTEWSFQYILNYDLVSFSGSFEQVYKPSANLIDPTWDKYGSQCVLSDSGSSIATKAECDLRWNCSNGVCSPSANGIYNTQSDCEAALIPPPFQGGQISGATYSVTITYRFRAYNASNVLFFDGNNTPSPYTVTGKILSITTYLRPNPPYTGTSGTNDIRIHAESEDVVNIQGGGYAADNIRYQTDILSIVVVKTSDTSIPDISLPTTCPS